MNWKRLIIFAVALIMMTGCSATQKENKEEIPRSLIELAEQYKKEEISLLQSGPEKLIDGLISSGKNFDTADYTEWEDPYFHFAKMQKGRSSKTVLFGLPADMSVLYSQLDDSFVGVTVTLDFGLEKDLSLNVAEAACRYMFDEYGDADSITDDPENLVGESVEISEHNLRESYWDEGNYTCTWSVGDDWNISVTHGYWTSSVVTITAEQNLSK